MIPILTETSTVICPHGGMAVLTTSNVEAKVDGAAMLLISDQHSIAGCPFTTTVPMPCLRIQWLTAATQTNLHGIPVLLQNSVGLCLNVAMAPQGTAVVVQTQQKAKGI
ncbi:hypothetical protein ACVW0Y_001118 [Pseudomonas sp. TE3786]